MKPMTEGVLRELVARYGMNAEVQDIARSALDYLARTKAAEEARDLAIVERDEAYRQRDEMKERADDHLSLIRGARTILGATDSEALSDAARRVVAARDSLAEPDPHKTVLDEVRAALAVPYGESVVAKAKWIMEARAMSHKMQNEREDEIDRLRKRVAELEAAEAEPAQTFHPQISVKIHSVGGVYVCAELDVGDITDPAFLSLSGNDYARLALVVTRG